MAGKLDVEELRVALVMNGGVSLAVWMGGVTRELDRLRRSDGAYERLLALTSSEPRIDVIAGASAGGINGAVLALAIARDTTAEPVRDLWMKEGAIGDLLRDPLERDAPSVLKGDGHMLPGLNAGLSTIAEGPPEHAPETPVHLTVTGTTLSGEVTRYPDHFGAVIADTDHRAQFTFRRGRVGDPPPPGGSWPDDFAREGDHDQAVARLALAARSSASFPAAFEPSLCPVREPANGDPAPVADPLHPDMAGVASFTASSWVIDGGVLVNTPFRPALDAIATLPAARPVRRILGYVVPHLVLPAEQPEELGKAPSALSVVVDSISRLPRVQSIGRELEEIEENNRDVRRRRTALQSTLGNVDFDELGQVATLVFGTYLEMRRRTAAEQIVELLLDGRRERAERPPPTPRQAERLREAFARVHDAPWLPPAFSGDAWDEVPVDLTRWTWGFAPVEHAANVLLETLKRLLEETRQSESQADVQNLRRLFHENLGRLREIRFKSAQYWRTLLEADDVLFEADDTGTDDARAGERLDQRVAERAVGWEPFAAELARVMSGFAYLAGRALEIAQATSRPAERNAGPAGARTILERVAERPLPREPVAVPVAELEPTVRRLLALDVVRRASGADLTGIDQEVELVLMSADAGDGLGPPRPVADKLAGLQLGHFGSFFKRSWRANDWMWGRLDGADRLVRAVLDPRRIRMRMTGPEDAQEIADEIRAIACAIEPPPPLSTDEVNTSGMTEWLTARWDERAVLAELEWLANSGDEPSPIALPESYAAVRRRIQLEIACEEIPKLAQAVRQDGEDRASQESDGARWARDLPGRPLDVDQVVDAFRACHIGQEKIAGEVGSDYFTAVSTRALAVTGSVLQGTVAGVRVLSKPLAIVRGLLLSLYLLGRGVTGGTRTGSFLVALVLALGGALVALYLIGVDIPGFLLLLGTVLLIAGFLLGLIRDAGWRLLVVVALFGCTIAGYHLVRDWDDRYSWADPAATAAAVLLVALVAMLLGGLRGARR
jgi:patatin-related protein